MACADHAALLVFVHGSRDERRHGGPYDGCSKTRQDDDGHEQGERKGKPEADITDRHRRHADRGEFFFTKPIDERSDGAALNERADEAREREDVAALLDVVVKLVVQIER